MKTEKIIALYDEHCILCQQTKKTMQKLDWFDRVEWISLQDYERKEGSRKFRPVDLRRELHIIDKKGKVLKGFYAVRRLFLLFPMTILAGLAMYIPLASTVGKPLYKWIADNRYKFLGKKCENGSCSLH